jgi:hypothetical protein
VALAGSYVYVTDYSGLRIISVVDPAHPAEVGSCDSLTGARGISVSGDYAYVACSFSMRVISVADPAHPLEVGQCHMPGGTYSVAASGTYAYVAADDGGLRVVSIADPAHPVEVGYYAQSFAHGVAVLEDYAYVGMDYYGGLWVFQFYGQGVEDGPKPQASSHKLGPTVLSGASAIKRFASCAVLDAMGRRVSSPKPGVYFVREAQAQAQAVHKIVIAR